ncbi:hypothetical protein EJ06DRAFT_405918 [Trichodelitschia bisporula]|uniref:Uncharacterized protein n=1 Tax=Trichodelitschia bisporula TaxID=703511 RepID=A0A6G1HXK0_9PEZI|nr:hypothetical protein EJ06DRAFT_405918 [Trichodelitschia bisporula]
MRLGHFLDRHRRLLCYGALHLILASYLGTLKWHPYRSHLSYRRLGTSERLAAGVAKVRNSARHGNYVCSRFNYFGRELRTASDGRLLPWILRSWYRVCRTVGVCFGYKSCRVSCAVDVTGIHLGGDLWLQRLPGYSCNGCHWLAPTRPSGVSYGKWCRCREMAPLKPRSDAGHRSLFRKLQLGPVHHGSVTDNQSMHRALPTSVAVYMIDTDAL